jgi:two-component system OmpR family response regulator
MSSERARKRKALIIDDESDICYLLSSILKQKNIQTVFAGSLVETDRILQSADQFGYIFLDNHLPDGLGTSYIQRLKNRFPETRVIMITAHDSAEDRNKATENGIDSFIGKPFSTETILHTVDAS